MFCSARGEEVVEKDRRKTVQMTAEEIAAMLRADAEQEEAVLRNEERQAALEMAQVKGKGNVVSMSLWYGSTADCSTVVEVSNN